MILSYSFPSDNNYVLHCDEEVFARDARLCEDSCYFDLRVCCTLWFVVFYGGFHSVDLPTFPQGRLTFYVLNKIKNVPSAVLSCISTRDFLRTRDKC